VNVRAEIPSSASLLGHRVRWTASIFLIASGSAPPGVQKVRLATRPDDKASDVEPVAGAFLLRVVEADVGSYEAVVDAT
jgi:hypothetical protein